MTREEAIKTVRNIYQTDAEKEALETLIPELAESEDERMIKWLHYLIEIAYTTDLAWDIPKDDTLAWLEKQKELFESGRGFYYYDGEKTTLCGYLITEENPYDFAISQQEEKQKEPLTPLAKALSNFLKNDFEFFARKEWNEAKWNEVMNTQAMELQRLAYLEKQKKQKPVNDSASTMIPSCWSEEQKPVWSEDFGKEVESVHKRYPEVSFAKLTRIAYHFAKWADKYKSTDWSDTDNIGWDEAFACVTRAEKSAKNEEELQNAVTAEKWLKEIKFKYYVHPVKQERSEGDEKTFWGLTAYIPNEELERLGVTRDDILKKLKSISLQPIQLKEAYKEGFQTARHATALAFMKYLDENRPEGKMCLSNGECEEIEKAFLVGDWEKIERYFHKCHWKPNEEQMKALQCAIVFMEIRKASDYDITPLKLLYEHLKKLIV